MKPSFIALFMATSILCCHRFAYGCPPGETFIPPGDCNTCVCGKDGKTQMCTFMACPLIPLMYEEHEYLCTQITETYIRTVHDVICEPRAKMDSDDCNSCYCSEDGKSKWCTQESCPNERTVGCNPAKPTTGPCNHCSCNSDGSVGICKHLPCDEPDPQMEFLIDVRRNTYLCKLHVW